jgi:phosphohistidine phosphatase SixA
MRFRALIGAAIAATWVCTPVRGQDESVVAAIAAAREGGAILVCRHGITDSFSEREPVDYDDPSTQRRLDERGEAQSRRIGEALARLGVEVTSLVASPMQRARRTAELMFDRAPLIDSIWHTNGSDYTGRALDARRQFLSRRVTHGNVLVVSHIGTMTSVLPGIDGGVGEGDCVVVRPRGEGHDVVGVVPWQAWEGAR